MSHINFEVNGKIYTVPDDDPINPSREITAEAETLPVGSPATAAVETDSNSTRFKFGIPAGEKGEKGEPGANGAPGAKGDKGEKGADGYTPKRGTDYWTAADIAEIKDYIDNEIINGEY